MESRQALPELKNITLFPTNHDYVKLELVFNEEMKKKLCLIMQTIKEAIDKAIRESLSANLEQQKSTLINLVNEKKRELVLKYIEKKQAKLNKTTSFANIIGKEIILSNSKIDYYYFHDRVEEKSLAQSEKFNQACIHGKAAVETLAGKFNSPVLDNALLNLNNGKPLNQETPIRIFSIFSSPKPLLSSGNRVTHTTSLTPETPKARCMN